MQEYQGLLQFHYEGGFTVKEGEGTAPKIDESVTTWTATEFDAYSSDRTYGNSKVRLENITLKMSGDYPFFTVPGATTEGRIAYPESMYGFDSANNGRHFNIEGYMIGYSINSSVTRNLIIVTKAELISLDAPTALAITASSNEVEVSRTLKLTVTPTPANASSDVNWTSSDTTKATVSSEGVVTGVAEGSVTITATSKLDANVKATYDITVVPYVEVQETLLGTYDIKAANHPFKDVGPEEGLTYAATPRFTNDTLEELFKEDTCFIGETNPLTDVKDVVNVNDGNATGGAFEMQGGLIKMGTSKATGTFTMIFEGKNITKVELSCFTWNEKESSSNYFNVNGTKLLAPYNSGNAPETLVFEGEFGSEIKITSENRGFLFAIKVYGA